MKILAQTLGILLSGLLLVGIYSCSSSAEEAIKSEKTEINSENIVVADYSIEGMVCAMGCAKTIQDEVAAMNGVASCEVNYEEQKAHVEYDGSQLSENEVITLIETLADGKYKVSEWKEKVNEDVEEIEIEDVSVSEGEDVSGVNVSLSSINIPNLFELLFKQL